MVKEDTVVLHHDVHLATAKRALNIFNGECLSAMCHDNTVESG